MARNQILDLPLAEVMRAEIALPLQQILQIYTVGNFLRAWRSTKLQTEIEQIFDSPEQAQHAVAICSGWLGVRPSISVDPTVGFWWNKDTAPNIQA